MAEDAQQRDDPGLWPLVPGGAVALLPAPLRGTVLASGVSWGLWHLSEPRPVPCLYDHTTQHGQRCFLQSSCGHGDLSAGNWIITVIFRKIQHCWIAGPPWVLWMTAETLPLVHCLFYFLELGLLGTILISCGAELLLIRNKTQSFP